MVDLCIRPNQTAYHQCRKEDLSLYGNELNYMTTAWTVGYVIGEIPSNMILTRIRPSIWIPPMEVKRFNLPTMRSYAKHEARLSGPHLRCYFRGVRPRLRYMYCDSSLASQRVRFILGCNISSDLGTGKTSWQRGLVSSIPVVPSQPCFQAI